MPAYASYLERAIPLLLLAAATTGFAGTESGNELCLRFASADGRTQPAIRSEAVGKLFFFRYLRISGLEQSAGEEPLSVRFTTVEPSSDMLVTFVVRKRESLKKVEGLAVDDAIAVTGRVTALGEPGNTVTLDPVIVRYKDRLAPKAGKELLNEVDPNARRGTDTSTGEEKVLK